MSAGMGRKLRPALALMIALVLCTGWSARAGAEVLLAYTAVENAAELPGDGDMIAPGITALPVTRGPGLTPVALGDGSFASSGWTVLGDRAQAEAEGSYLSWAFEADSPITLTSLGLGYRRGGHAPEQFQLEVSTDGGASWQVLHWEHVNNASSQQMTLDLAAQGLAEAESFQFRLYAWDARRQGNNNDPGTVRLENTVAPPESGAPRAIVLGGTPVALPAEVEAEKTVIVHSQDGTGCGDLAGTRPPGPHAAIPGACLEYRIDTVNTGAGTAADLRIIDTLGPEIIFVGADHAGYDTSAPAFSFSTPEAHTDCGGEACEVRLDDGALAAGQAGEIVIRGILK